MSQDSRPGGLLALAIINFLFGAIGTITVLLGAVAIANKESLIEVDPGSAELFNKLEPSALMFSAILSILLITSGVGYLKQKKKIGWLVGNLYSVTAIVHLMSTSSSFNVMSIAVFLFPIITLVLLNVVFKKDFINP